MIIDDLMLYTKGLKYRLTMYKPTYPNYEVVAFLKEAYNISFTSSLKESNRVELTFSIPQMINNEINDNFDLIKTGYIILLEKYSDETDLVFSEEYMLISNIDNVGNEKDIKNVICVGIEAQLNKKLLKSFSGVKKIYRTQAEILAYTASETYPTLEDFINSGCLNVVCQLCPSWSVDESDIDAVLMDLYRDINIDSTSCLDFLINDMQNSFSCLFVFNRKSKKISARSLTNLGTNRGFFISDKNYIKSIVETIDFENAVTKLYIYGKDELNIRSVNVTGEDYILDLSYYRNITFMSQGLLDALDNYDVLLDSKKNEFATLLTSLNDYTSSLTAKQVELAILKAEIVALEIQMDELIAEKASLTSINAQIDIKKTEISSKENEIISVQSSIDTVINSIETLQSDLLMSNNFTLDQIKELDQYIIEKEVTDNTYTNAQELFDEGVKTLGRINQPSVQFDIDVVDLFNCVECQLDWNKVSLGDVAYIKYDKFNIDIELRLIGFSHDYESNKLTLTFGNRNNLNDPSMIIAEDIKTAISAATTLDIQKYKYLDYINSGDKNAIYDYINSLLNLGAQGAIAGANNEVTIDHKGITLSNPAYPQRQVRLMYDGIYFTVDGWQTSEIALTSENGVVAETIRGVLGQFCTVQANQITLNNDGTGIEDVYIKVSHTDGGYTSMKSDGLLRYVPHPIYEVVPTGIPDQISFMGKTIAGLEAQGWEFFGDYSIASNRLYFNIMGWAKIYKEITADNAQFKITYYTNVDTVQTYAVIIDGVTYSLPHSTTAGVLINHTITIPKGLHSFVFIAARNNSDYACNMYIDNIVFEQNPVVRNQIDTNVEGKAYNYITHVGRGSTYTPVPSSYQASRDVVVDTWIQLPDEFRGKNFELSVFIEDTGSQTGRFISEFKCFAHSIDYENARFMVTAYVRYTNFTSTGSSGMFGISITHHYTDYWNGCDFTYIATY